MISRAGHIPRRMAIFLQTLGLPDAEGMLEKPDLALNISETIKHQKLTRNAAAKMIGTSGAHSVRYAAWKIPRVVDI